MRIKVKVAGSPTAVEILRDNAKTWVVRLPDGNIIKRHKVKHAV